MFGMKKSEKMSYGIVGLGRFGSALTEELARSGAELLVIDKDEEKVREVRELTENALVVSNLDKRTLMETGIQNCDVAIVCIGEHMESSILTTLNLVSLGIPEVISKATSPEHGEILARLGAKVVYPERDMAIRLANRLETSRVLDFIQLSQKINISKLRIPKRCIGKTVSRAMEVANMLKKDKIEADVINTRFLKPLDKEKIKKSIEKTKFVITVEDGTIINGLGTAIKELIIDENIKDVKIKSFAYPDEFIKHGKVEELEEIYHQDKNSIYKYIKNNIIKEKEHQNENISK